jgi:hypothetical protein
MNAPWRSIFPQATWFDVPARSDLDIRLRFGELAVKGIEGHKEVRMSAGELNLDVGDPSAYRDVSASVRVGEVNARPFRISKGGFWRSFKLTGSGPYGLRATIGIGEINFLWKCWAHFARKIVNPGGNGWSGITVPKGKCGSSLPRREPAWKASRTKTLSKKLYVGWISLAKREETRKKHLADAIQMLTQNQKLGLR